MAKILKCEKCGSPMIKQGSIRSGNAKYDRYVCEACRNVSLKCTGLQE
ncbi:MAG: recombinase zinc beta ribbon domain-containing protein [Candidatus Woesearchaeota archaeon]|nr:recombinase zinc beta ribbon domain-containing protein [Candidatus Woesearchaeota archaeon]